MSERPRNNSDTNQWVRIDVSGRQLKGCQYFRSKSTYSWGRKWHDFGIFYIYININVNITININVIYIYTHTHIDMTDVISCPSSHSELCGHQRECQPLGTHQIPFTAPFHLGLIPHQSQGTGKQSGRFYSWSTSTNLSLPLSQDQKLTLTETSCPASSQHLQFGSWDITRVSEVVTELASQWHRNICNKPKENYNGILH